ncbi:MAG: glycogen debranching protein GlgX [Mobiluncus porci]|uniref:glycogen debranching protein GlgX n=1 Tax=Mobiluncus porci TaxID=2652278 RepID=UPI0023EF9381|nr:glycogen debranching protein GlgX [Mobiluncus porci]MDD7541601.1 glycogen debranching protein GlgX [Mobiluncus porci]MDY5748350.1 glycogen debranching protein GlgX [Mobiluncus porci]
MTKKPQPEEGPTFTPTEDFAPEPKLDPHRLGAHLTDSGVAFSVYARQATAVELCLLSPQDDPDDPDGVLYEERRIRLLGPFRGIWHGNIPGIRPGQIYGYRCYGPWDPNAGLFYNPQKILLDPYAKAITKSPRLTPRLYAHQVNDKLEPATRELKLDPLDSLPDAALGVVVNTQSFPVSDKPRRSWRDTVIYEAHVKGLTRTLSGIPPDLQGTYAGLANPVTIQYLKDLGVTAIELLPIHAKFSEPFLQENGRTNYWGYSTLSYFAPEPSYATEYAQRQGPQAVLDEVRGMVSLLHQAGIEVFLDVVYNHTAEGGTHGTSVSLRGLDPQRYYVWDHGSPNRMVDYTGCGNTVDFTSNEAVGLMLDSLRYWAGEVGIDGFRFDLGVTIGRNREQFAVRHPSFVGMATDPILAGCKLIAEPWDMGPNGWQTGNFPSPFADWNDRYRDAIRGFWLTDGAAQVHGRHAHGPHELATRISGSADFYSSIVPELNRGPGASINFIAAHDGFTLADLVTYNHKHNEANGENNHDGTNNNNSWNHEYEGHVLRGLQYSDDPKVLEEVVSIAPLRLRNLRNMWGTLAISAGTPMFLAGDEFGNSQEGNNNAYCVDAPLSWLDWRWLPWQKALHETVQYLLRLRADHPVMRPDSFASGMPVQGDKLADLSWYDRTGAALTPGAWHDPRNRVVQMLRSGAPWGDVDLLVMINGTMDQVEVNPPPARSRVFRLVWDSTWPNPTNRSEESPDSLGVPGYDLPFSALTKGEKPPAEAVDRLAAEVGVTPGSGLRLAEVISELPVTVRGMTSKMEAMSMRIFFAEVPENPSGNAKIDLLNVLKRVQGE